MNAAEILRDTLVGQTLIDDGDYGVEELGHKTIIVPQEITNAWIVFLPGEENSMIRIELENGQEMFIREFEDINIEFKDEDDNREDSVVIPETFGQVRDLVERLHDRRETIHNASFIIWKAICRGRESS